MTKLTRLLLLHLKDARSECGKVVKKKERERGRNGDGDGGHHRVVVKKKKKRSRGVKVHPLLSLSPQRARGRVFLSFLCTEGKENCNKFGRRRQDRAEQN